MKKNKILVIIVSYNWMQWIDRCITSVYSSTIPADIFVVDNGSTDGTLDYLEKNYRDIILVKNNNNSGFGRANNIGLKYSISNNYDYVYLLNQDAWIMPETLETLVSISQNNKEYAILSPVQMTANLKHIDLNFKRDTCSYRYNKDFMEDLYLGRTKLIYDVPNVMAAHWFMTVEGVKTIGGFSPSFPHYAEDVNYCDRCYFWNLKVGIVPSLKVVHDREFRDTPFKKKIYIKYVEMISSESNPHVDDGLLLFKHIKMLIKDFVKYRNFLPIKYCYMLLRNHRKIVNNKKISMSNKCAFLDC